MASKKELEKRVEVLEKIVRYLAYMHDRTIDEVVDGLAPPTHPSSAPDLIKIISHDLPDIPPIEGVQ